MTEVLQEQAREARRTASREVLVEEITSQMLTAVEFSTPAFGQRPERPLADEYSVGRYWKQAGFRQVLPTEAVIGSELGLDGDVAKDHFGFVGVRSLGRFRRGYKPFGFDYDDRICLVLYPHDSKRAQYQPVGRADLMEMSPKDFAFAKKLADRLVPADRIPTYLRAE